MSRKYNVSKKNKKIKFSTAILVSLIGVSLVGALGALSNGFNDWDYKNWFKPDTSEKEDTRLDLVKINTESTNKGKELNTTTIISFLNRDLEDPIFKEVSTLIKVDDNTKEESTIPLLGYVYEDNGGLKFGSSSKLGYFTIDLVEDYTFNRCKIVGRNYSALNNLTNIYSCDETSISVNGAEMKTFKTNEEDTTIIAPTEEFEFNFDDNQTELKIETQGKRCTLFSIELWTE